MFVFKVIGLNTIKYKRKEVIDMLVPCVKFLLLAASVFGILFGVGFLLINFWWVFLIVLAVWMANLFTAADISKTTNNNDNTTGGGI